MIYSLIEATKEIGLDPFCYLTWLYRSDPGSYHGELGGAATPGTCSGGLPNALT